MAGARNRGKTRGVLHSDGVSATADKVWQKWNDRLASNGEPMTGVSGNAQAFQAHNFEQYGHPSWGGRWANSQGQGQGQWRGHIDAQEQRVARLQQRVNQMNAASHGPFGTATFEGPYTRSQAIQNRMTERSQQMLDQEKQRLDNMEDAARHSGANGSTPY